MLQRRSPDDPADELHSKWPYEQPAIEAVIDAAYALLCSKQGNVSAVEIVRFVSERIPIDPARIRAEFTRLLRRRGAEW
jgi:hypothetical protein